MKKILFYTACSVALCSFYSCSNDEKTTEQSNQVTIAKSNVDDAKKEIDEFRAALKMISLPENQPTQEEKIRLGSELSDHGKKLLLPAAKDLIYASGVTENQLNSQTNNDINEILNMGFKVYVDLTSKK